MSSRRNAIAPRVEWLETRELPATMAVSPMPARASSAAVLTAADDPVAITGITDPSLIKQGGVYYLFSSGPTLQTRESTDLRHWTELGPVFGSIPVWAVEKVPRATQIWAPDISFFDGEYHLYYAVSTFGSQRSVIGLATNTTLDPTSPGYRWVNRGEVVASRPGRDNFNAIDPNVTIDTQGGVWLTFGSQWSGIKQLRLDPSTGLPLQGHATKPATLASRPGHGLIEASFVFRMGGFYYLFASFGTCCEGAASTYKIVVGRSTSVNGPYVDRSGRSMTHGGGTVVLAGTGRFAGPGSNAVLLDGGQAYLVYQSYDIWNGAVPTLQIRPLAWTTSGWPVVGDALFS
jgi:arabinan endo-1,5-alpha-L-arabinosidase